MPVCIRIMSDNLIRYGQRFLNTNYEESWSRLRHKSNSINHECAKAVLPRNDRRADCCEVLSTMGSKSTADIFKDDESRAPAFLAELLHERPKRPEGSGSFTAK